MGQSGQQRIAQTLGLDLGAAALRDADEVDALQGDAEQARDLYRQSVRLRRAGGSRCDAERAGCRRHRSRCAR